MTGGCFSKASRVGTISDLATRSSVLPGGLDSGVGSLDSTLQAGLKYAQTVPLLSEGEWLGLVKIIELIHQKLLLSGGSGNKLQKKKKTSNTVYINSQTNKTGQKSGKENTILLL